GRLAELPERDLPTRKPEGAGQSVHPCAIRGNVLGLVAAKFLLLGPPGRQDGPPPIRHRMEGRTNPNRQPYFHPGDAAPVLVRYLSGDGESISPDPVAQNRAWPFRDGACLCDRRLHSGPHRRWPATAHP